ncbi:MAG: cobyrinate a,c-diamide synthase [Desertimonas sp.]
MPTSLPPRIVVAGTHSGVGKTTVATGLMAALRRRGRRVGTAKVGPDFIDPGYHAIATGAPSRNLDAWISGIEAIGPLAARAGEGRELLVIEGVMGLFDGARDGTPSSTAEVAVALGAPVLLVVDAAATSHSVAAVVHGFATFDPRVRIAGVVLNRVGSDAHREMLVEALAPVGIPVVGTMGRDEALAWRDRHLGLVPVVEHADEVTRSVARLGVVIERRCDLGAIEDIALSAPALTVAGLPRPAPVGDARIAVAAGPAFSFQYPDNVEALVAAGAEILAFDPLEESALPDGADALVAGGGFPEVFAAELADNRPLLHDIAARSAAGLAVWAECGGLLWLADRLDKRAMAGVVPTAVTMTDRLTLGYREATITDASPLGPAATSVRGHEFHYSTCAPTGSAITLRTHRSVQRAGFATERMLASYLHLHLATRPDIAEHFVVAATRRIGRPGERRRPNG